MELNVDEPFEAKFSIDYDEEKAKKHAQNNSVNRMVFNTVSSVVVYFSHSRVSQYPIHHVGYLDNDMLFVVSNDCAWFGQGPNKGDFIIRTAVSNVCHNRNHDKLGQFYVTLRK